MKLIKFLLWVVVIALIPLCTIVAADDCFDTIIGDDGNVVFYINPFNEYTVFRDREYLFSIYWDKIKCAGEKKVYSQSEYNDKILSDYYNWDEQKKQPSLIWSIFALTSWLFSLMVEVLMLILSFIAMRKIFVKAWKPGIYSIIPIYNFYELSDIAWLQWIFWKAFLCRVIWIVLFLFAPLLWIILVLLSAFYGVMVNFYVARNFWWSTAASILYVIFNPVAMMILAFWNDKYYQIEQKEKLKEISRKVKMDEMLGNPYTEHNSENFNNISEWNVQSPEDPIKYIDPSQFV